MGWLQCLAGTELILDPPVGEVQRPRKPPKRSYNDAVSRVLCAQACWSKPSCATRLKASAATVLSRRGATTPHGQREQHQPVKFSSSAQIICLVIGTPSLWTSSEGWTSAGGEKSCR